MTSALDKISRRSLLEIARGLYRAKGGIETGTTSTTTVTEDATTTTTTALHSPVTPPHHHHQNQKQQRPWRCFRLQQKHFGSFGTPSYAPTPADFHDLLCDRIRNAKRRVYLASLYIGPAVDDVKYDKEVELLNAIRDVATSSSSSDSSSSGGSTVEIKILLDHNRALRPVPTGKGSHTTSAEACRQAMQSPNDYNGGSTDGSNGGGRVHQNKDKNHSVHLFSVLPEPLQRLLPNPLNEVCGVFHLKAYIIDDELILSGANLSQEYFTDRCDRYLWILEGGGGLTDCYADLISVLCQHGVEYKSNDDDDDSHLEEEEIKRKQPKLSLIESLEQVLTKDADLAAAEGMDGIDDDNDDNNDRDDDDSQTVAYCVPTFQAPAHFGLHPRLRSDVETVRDVLQSASIQRRGEGGATTTTNNARSEPDNNNNQATGATVRLATAYLNPTDSILTACRDAAAVHLLTAGRVSHGFKPKNHQAGNKGKDFIPAIFTQLAMNATAKTKKANNSDSTSCTTYLWYYQRPDWTFHAKGIWLSDSNENVENDDNKHGLRLSTSTPHHLYMVTHGSGNFGARSEHRDMESNLLLFLPAKSPLQTTFAHEWNSFCDHTGKPESEPVGEPLAWHWRMALPYIRSFF
jgi:CDP-diacylglycerol--glycerol-3-phosphate 3-phosphatidyltransferase